MDRENTQKEHRSIAHSREDALALDESDSLQHFRSEFIIPTKGDLKRTTISKKDVPKDSEEQPSIYLCGNSLGLQPRRTITFVDAHLGAWATKGVFGHFKVLEDSRMPPFVDVDDLAAQRMAPIVGASASEVAIMETLSANLHLMMASFYQPTPERYKIILEGKAFPSDHYAVESQIRHHNLDPGQAMVLIEPSDLEQNTVTTAHILSVIDKHASSTALILLPGVQYYTGQFFDIPTITAHAHAHNITIGWDLAHAVGNVELRLHDWDVDFAVWCSYKYLNCGPGAIGGLFVHERHGQVDTAATSNGNDGFRPRLSGWWGGDKAVRFQMGNRMWHILYFHIASALCLAKRPSDFVPIPGAAGFQVGNPCALAVAPLLASLEIFGLTSMSDLRSKSIRLTNFLEELLDEQASHIAEGGSGSLYQIITPAAIADRGAQLSIRLVPGLLEGVMAELEEHGVVVDERKPDVVRVAPTPLYNTFQEVWDFVTLFGRACLKASQGQAHPRQGTTALAGTGEKGWSQIK
ncbi:MAG: hypothetical protein Q9220_001045 [cf. Caloplaca sp. 1 TL-2023]